MANHETMSERDQLASTASSCSRLANGLAPQVYGKLRVTRRAGGKQWGTGGFGLCAARPTRCRVRQPDLAPGGLAGPLAQNCGSQRTRASY